MTSSTDSGPLTDRDWARLNEQCEALERAWREDEDGLVDLGRFLPAVEDPLRRRCLLELIKTELEIRWRRNLPITLDNYLARFRELGPIHALPASMIYEEYRTRHLYGDRPKLETYRDRFSTAQFEELQQLLNEQPLTVVQCSTLQPPAPSNTLDLPPPPSSPSQTPLLPSSEPIGDQIIPSEGYTLGPEIGSGQFGVVFRATAPGGIPVAVKRIMRPLSDEMCKRELRALELLSQLRHPALLSIHTFWQRQDRLIIVMELADESLADCLKECKKAGREGIPPGELIAYFREAAEALDYLHSQNLMHRDIKPANLLRLKRHAKVADFGLVRLQAQSLDATLPSGTPLYMPPECFRGQVSVHSDQYSLAITYAEMRLGRRIFRSKNMLDLALEHEKGTPDLNGLGEAERKVLLRALAKKPDGRYPSCHEFVQALSEVVLPKPSPPPRRSFAARVLTVMILALLGLLGLVSYLYIRIPPTPVLPPELPSGFVPDGETTIKVHGKHRHYQRIRYTKLQGVDPLVFVLIPKLKGAHPHKPPTFYIMENKVSREQFTAQLPRMETLLQQLSVQLPKEDEVWRTVRREWKQKWLKSGEPEHGKWPATHTTVTEAHCFAESLGDRCRLPHFREWDAAGGFYDDKKAPFNHAGPGLLAINLQPDEFWDVGTAKGDESCYHCRDMGGNGYEWTWNVTGGLRGDVVPVAKPTPDYSVIRRGQRPDRDEPFTFAMEKDERLVDYGDAPEDTSFRVVLPLDE
ncbi:MAG TPA: protein kinase [Gemmataceae bacterium]